MTFIPIIITEEMAAALAGVVGAFVLGGATTCFSCLVKRRNLRKSLIDEIKLISSAILNEISLETDSFEKYEETFIIHSAIIYQVGSDIALLPKSDEEKILKFHSKVKVIRNKIKANKDKIQIMKTLKEILEICESYNVFDNNELLEEVGKNNLDILRNI